MTPEQFAYWLQGYMEISGNGGMSATQKQIIRDHLAEVFDKKTPSYNPNTFAPWDNGTVTTTETPQHPPVFIC